MQVCDPPELRQAITRIHHIAPLLKFMANEPYFDTNLTNSVLVWKLTYSAKIWDVSEVSE